LSQPQDRSPQLSLGPLALLTRVLSGRGSLCELLGIFKKEFPCILQPLEEAVESLELSRELAKQALSLLSYTLSRVDTDVLRGEMRSPLSSPARGGGCTAIRTKLHSQT
jgi:hypothetical protein